MAVVATYKTPWGVCQIRDDCYANKTEAELAQVRREMNAAVNRAIAGIVQRGGEDYARLLKMTEQN